MKNSDKRIMLCRYIECCIRLNCDYSHVLGKPLCDLDFESIERFIERHIIEPVTQTMSYLMIGQSFYFADRLTRWEFVGPVRPGIAKALNKSTELEHEFSYNTEIILSL
jgi:hypothetical protein